MTSKKRICVSGMGLITPLGTGVNVFWENLLAGKSGIRTVKVFQFPVDPEENALHISAPMDFTPYPEVDESLPETLYVGDRYLCHATAMAIEDAGCDTLPRNTAVVIGAGASSTLNIEEYEAQLSLDIAENRKLTQIPMGILSSDKILANRFGLYGPKMMIATACSSSSLAVGNAYDLISMGECDCALVGCVDTLCQLTHSGFYGLRSIDPDRCKPFDKTRKGLSVGEAAGVLILEPEEEVHKRGKKPYCFMEGYAANCDASRMTSPDETGDIFTYLMQKALKEGSVEPEEVDYICAHGTGTVLNDITEAKAIQKVFGAKSPWVSSIKGAVGHCMAGAGIINCAATALSLKYGMLPPNTGMENQDERCNINILKQAQEYDCRVAITSAFGFGGNNVSIVFKRGI